MSGEQKEEKKSQEEGEGEGALAKEIIYQYNSNNFAGEVVEENADSKTILISNTYLFTGKKALVIPKDSLLYGPDSLVRDDNLKDVLEENNKLKSQRIECLKMTIDYLNKIGVIYWISDGTLLSAYRDNGVMIDKDTDTDISILESDMPKLWENRHLLSSDYKVDPTAGGLDWSKPELINVPFELNKHVCKKFTIVDVRDYRNILKHTINPETDVYTFRIDEEGYYRNNYAKPSQHVHLRKWKKEWLFPLKDYNFEGLTVKGPNNAKAWLEELYGYIGYGAFWNPKTKKYEKKADYKDKELPDHLQKD